MSLQGRKPGITEDALAKAVTKLHTANKGFGPYPTAILKAIAAVDESVINYDLIEGVIAHVIAAEAADGPMALLNEWSGLDDAPDMGRTPLPGPGAILVFLPGSLEISRLQRQLEESGAIKRALAGSTAKVLPLHGSLPPDQQAAVFKGYGPRCRKIVLSTNIAETSVTIADVTVVVDTGKMKEMQYDPHGGLSRLAETWLSKASAKQRRGRAGRVRCTTPRQLPKPLLLGSCNAPTPTPLVIFLPQGILGVDLHHLAL
jgi:ATP-dependent RNA helicase DHX57